MSVARKIEKIIHWLLPREQHFFELIDEAARIAKEGSQYLVSLCCEKSELREEFLAKIMDAEKRSDRVTGRAFVQLNKTFVTPLDRSDIFSITNVFRKISHAIEGTASQIPLHALEDLPAGSCEISNLILQALERIELGVRALSGMRDPLELRAQADAVARFEREGDVIFHAKLQALFASEKDAIRLIKHKEFLEGLEHVLDLCEEAASALNTVFVKNT